MHVEELYIHLQSGLYTILCVLLFTSTTYYGQVLHPTPTVTLEP